MDNIPNWKCLALQGIDMALVGTPQESAVNEELRCAKSFFSGCTNLSDVLPEDVRNLTSLLLEVSEYLHDNERHFSAKMIESAVSQLAVEISEEVGD